MRSIISDKNALSDVVGFILLLSVVATAIGFTLVMSMPELLRSQDEAQYQNIEQAFTVLDSHTSKAQYSNYLSQTTEMKLAGGTVYVNETDSSIVVMLSNTPVYSGYLGTIHYIINGHDIGYQCGGIWESYESGGSVMLSAPDFNYKHETLTLPIMQIRGNGSASGTGKLYITTRSDPSPSVVFPLGTNILTSNPIFADMACVYITSDYYKGWADYINSRTDCAVRPGDVYDDNKTIKITFNTKPSCGTHPFTPPIWFRGINTSNPEPIWDLNFSLKAVTSSSQIDLRGPQSNSPGPYPSIHINFQKATGGGTSGIRIEVDYYLNSTVVESFEASKLYYIYPNDTCNINLLNSSIPTEYKINTRSVTWGANDTLFDAGDYDKTVPELKAGPSLDKVIEHYLLLMAENHPNGFALWKGNDGGQHWSGASSTYTLDYDAVDLLTFLHITNNNITVSIN